jgi:hypothetical protein
MNKSQAIFSFENDFFIASPKSNPKDAATLFTEDVALQVEQ